MEEKWIKVNEIEYTHKELSQIYKNLEEKDISDHTENLEDLVKDNFLIQELKNNSIPYACRWSEKLMEKKSKIPTSRVKQAHHYFVEILILKKYEEKYNTIIKNLETQVNNEYEELKDVNTDDDTEYEKFEKVKNAFILLTKGLLLITVCCAIYIIIKYIFNG